MKRSQQIAALQESLGILLTDISITPAAVDAVWLRERLVDVVEFIGVLAEQVHALAIECERVHSIVPE